MANLKIDLFLNSLRRSASFEMYIPNDPVENMPLEEALQKKTEMKTLILLHGYTGKAWNWVPEELARKHNLAIVSVNGENGFYLNGLSTGHQYQSMVGEEIIGYVRQTFGLATKPENTFLLGFSMGGFGALHTALAYPETFGKAGAMSSAMLIHGIAGMKPGEDNGVANYEYYRECFGDLSKVEESDNNPEVLVRRLKAESRRIPEIYMCCGTEDFLLESNRAFHSFLEEMGVTHIYRESKGIHDMVFWNEYTEKIIEWMCNS